MASSPEGKLWSPTDITYRRMLLSLCVASVLHKLSKFIIIAGDILSIVFSCLMQFRKVCGGQKQKQTMSFHRSDPIIICSDEGNYIEVVEGSWSLFIHEDMSIHRETRRSFIVHTRTKGHFKAELRILELPSFDFHLPK